MSSTQTFTADTYIDAYYPDQVGETYTHEQVKRMLRGYAKLKCEEQRNICFNAALKLLPKKWVGVDPWENAQLHVLNAKDPTI